MKFNLVSNLIACDFLFTFSFSKKKSLKYNHIINLYQMTLNIFIIKFSLYEIIKSFKRLIRLVEFFALFKTKFSSLNFFSLQKTYLNFFTKIFKASNLTKNIKFLSLNTLKSFKNSKINLNLNLFFDYPLHKGLTKQFFNSHLLLLQVFMSNPYLKNLKDFYSLMCNFSDVRQLTFISLLIIQILKSIWR